MNDICLDNRFKLIEKYKKKLIEGTNIETSPEEMAVLDNILFRFWQMGWLDRLEIPAPPERKGKWTSVKDGITYEFQCSECGCYHRSMYDFCPSCGAEMRG